jgi:hypothetical protein
MDRIWQWAWDRYGARYTWAIFAMSIPVVLPSYVLVSFIGVPFEKSDRYVEAAVATLVAVLVIGDYTFLLARRRRLDVDRAKALAATYTYARGAVARSWAGTFIGGAALLVVVGAITGATGSRLVQWAIIGASIGVCISLIGGRGFVEVALRPVRAAIAGDTGIGDALPRSRATFATWSNLSIVTVAFSFATGSALLASVFNRISEFPVLCVVIGCAMTLGLTVLCSGLPTTSLTLR